MGSGLAAEFIIGPAEGRTRWRRPGMTAKSSGAYVLLSDISPDTEAARKLLTAAAVRERAHQLLQAGLEGRLQHFTVDLARLEACADEVVATIREAYPSLDIPFHARWRHFSAGGHDRWEAVTHGAPWSSASDMARAAFDHAMFAVLRDAGAGPQWR